MYYFRTILAAFLAVLLILVPFTSCGGSSNGDDSTSENGGSLQEPEETTAEPETELVLVINPSPSLASVDEVEEIGVQAGDVIVACGKSFGGGAIYDGLNDSGRPRWEAAPAELWAIDPGAQIPEGFATVVVPSGTEIALVNNTGLEVLEDYYMDYLTGENVGETLPAEAGVYLRKITVNDPRPKASDPAPEIGAKFGDWHYFVVVSVE